MMVKLANRENKNLDFMRKVEIHEFDRIMFK
jgi:hypothetical protein